MAKVIEQIIAVKFSKIVKDSDTTSSVLSDSQEQTIEEGLPDIVDSLIDDNQVVIEVIKLS